MMKLLALLATAGALLLTLSIGSRGAVQASGIPANDTFANATVIDSIQYNDVIYTGQATSSGDPDVGSCSAGSAGYQHSVWYSYTPPFSQYVDIDTFGSNYNTVLAAFTGTSGNLSQVACNDDADNTTQSFIKVDLDGGVTYHFLVGSQDSNSAGTLSFNITPQDEFYFDDFALKCYQTRIAKRSARFHAANIATFDANFRFRTETTVQLPSFFCNPAGVLPLKSGSAGGGKRYPDDITSVCYKARDTQVFAKGGDPTRNARVFAQNELFGDQKLQLGRLESVCTLALKEHGVLPKLSPFAGQILRCYSARPAKGSARSSAVRVNLEDQFFNSQPKTATVLRPVTYCTLGGKSDNVNCIVLDCCNVCSDKIEPDVEPQEVAVVCYALRQPSFRPFDIPVIDQFLDQQFVDLFLTIKKADRICMPSVKKPPYAPNDEIKNATQVVLSLGCQAGSSEDECRFSDHLVTMNATRPRNDPPMFHCESVADSVDYGHSVWYTFTATSDFNHLDIDTEDSSYDTVVAVYTGSKGSLSQFACNDDDGSNLTSDLEVDLQVGQKYFIMVGSYGSLPGGKLKFNVEGCDGLCD